MWNQWSVGPPPMPPSSSNNSQPPLIGPVQPAGAPIPLVPAPPTQTDPAPPTPTALPVVQPVSYQSGVPSYTPAPPTPTALPAVQPVSYQSGAPSYTPAQYAAMTPEQQYAVQQHWQQWQAYEQQYAQWHAQYGEQYKREMAAIQSTPQATAVPYDTTAVSNAYNYPPPAISNPYQAPPVPVNAPPPPPPDDNTNSKGIKAPAQLYEQPPPPPPPPQQETSTQNRNDALVQSQSTSNSLGQNATLSQSLQNQENRWNQPPPFSAPNSGNRWNEPNEVQCNQQDRQYNQQSRQQQNQQNRQQNQFNQQDRQQQNQFNPQFNNNNPHGRQNQNNNSRNQQEDEQDRNNWQGNWQNNNNFRGRNRGRNGNNYESERQFDDSDGRINYQQQSWQSDNSGERNNRGNFSTRFDNSFDNFNKNLGQNNNQQSSNNWSNNIQSGNFGTPETLRQKQSSQNQSTPNQKTQKPATGGSVDEKAFDEQFRMWEEQFENWKKENANHPDRTMYMQYEREFEKTRVRLLERREQMRRRKMIEMQQKSNLQVETQELVAQQQQQTPQPTLPKQDQQQLEPKLPQKQTSHSETTQHIQHENYSNDSNKATDKSIETQKPVKTPEKTHCENSDMEQSEPEDSNLVLAKKLDDPSKEVENETEGLNISETSIFQKQEMTNLFNTGGGIPGLDLVGSKDSDVVNTPIEKEQFSNVELETDGPSRPPKLSATSSNSEMILTTTQPQLLTNIDSRSQSLFLSSQSQNSQPLKRKIPSLFDIVVEKPVLSPDTEKKPTSPLPQNPSPVGSRTSKSDIPPDADSHSKSISREHEILASPAQRPLSQMSMEQCNQQSLPNQQQPNLPPQAATLAKALQDPNVMQLLTVALAQAQKTGCINPTGNAQQNQFLQQLQQLQPLIQMQQERNYNNQPWDNSQLERPQQWRNQNQDFDNRFNTNINQNENSNNRFNSNASQNRNPFDNNLLNKNVDQMNQSRRSESVNISDSNRDMQQKNPRNPFRRGTGIEDKGNGGINLGNETEGTESGRGSFGNTNNNTFGAPINPQQQRGGNFANNNFSRDFSGGEGNFGGRNFSGRNFDEENFSRGGDNFRGNDSRDNNYDRPNFDGENSSGGGNFNNRPDSSFKNSLGFRNNTNSFGERGFGDNDYFRPTQIYDYQNRSRPEALMPPAKVVDYGHKPSALLPATSFNRDSNEFVPVKTIDYGHASTSAKPRNQFEEKNDNQTKKQINRWNQEQDTNQEPHQQQRSQIQGYRGNDNETKQQNENPNENNIDESSTPVDTENVRELVSENQQEYPKNKWILQNPENRQRPGPPTKRGKRNSTQFDPDPAKDEAQAEIFESDEIEENFEEISDNECSIIENTDIPPRKTQIKKKSVSLFPSVSDSNKTLSMIIPSNENNNTIPIDEILFKPGRLTRPKNIVIIMRGPPGSGKSHVAKLIKDKEVEMGGQTPRLLSVDDYFMVENDYEEKCPKTGRKIPKKEILYEYEKEMESTYMQYLIKSFKKTVTDHLFDFIIVDCGNQSLRTFNEFYNAARDGNFSPFVIDLKCDLETCLEQNIHNRKEEDIKEIIENYQDCPGHYIKLDVSNLLENVVEMEDVSDLEDHFVADSEIIELDDEEVEDEGSDNNDDGFLKSKWDTDPTTENLARLDGTSKPISKRGTATLEEYLQIDGWEAPASSTNGKKRVRWADIEEKRAQDKMRAIGFVVGQTDWNRMMDPTSGSGALTKTKYIERLNKRR